jgi:hypothetical protein
MGGTVTVWALHLPEGTAWQAQHFAGMVACCTSQKVTVPAFPVTSAKEAKARERWKGLSSHKHNSKQCIRLQHLDWEGVHIGRQLRFAVKTCVHAVLCGNLPAGARLQLSKFRRRCRRDSIGGCQHAGDDSCETLADVFCSQLIKFSNFQSHLMEINGHQP